MLLNSWLLWPLSDRLWSLVNMALTFAMRQGLSPLTGLLQAVPSSWQMLNKPYLFKEGLVLCLPPSIPMPNACPISPHCQEGKRGLSL